MARQLRCGLLILLCAIAWPTDVTAQPPAPPPAKYTVTLRYHIPAPRDQHVVQYDSLIRHLKRLEFGFDPPLEKHPETDREDRSKNYLQGSIASSKALLLLEHPVVQSIRLVPLAPDEFKLPEGPTDPVLVRLELAGNMTADRQRELANQTRVLLRELGFKEAAGYDQRGYTGRYYTRIVGTIPRSQLNLLQRELRNHPAGWFSPVIPRDELPSPLRGVNPVRVIEVLPDTEALREIAEPDPRFPDFLEKISADLWELVKGKDAPASRIRVQIAFIGDMSADDRAWKLMLQEMLPGFFLESQLGQFVTGTMRLDQVKTLASAPIVSVIRLPRLPQVNVDAGIKLKGNNEKALTQTGLKEFHERGHTGKAVRIAIIDRDFRGWEELVKKKRLPPKTYLLDLTTELNPEIYPLPYPGDNIAIGHGTLCAQAAALAAPQAELVLIRADVVDPYHLLEIRRYTTPESRFSSHSEQRHGEMVARTAQLMIRREELLRERQAILNDFTDETDKREYLEFLGPLFPWLYSDREWHRLRMEHHEQLERDHRRRENRLLLFLQEINRLQGIPIVVNALAWNSGYPLGSTSPLSKALDDPQKGPLWFQAVGNVRGQCWHGPFRSIPGDPAMKFADDAVPLPKGRWSNAVNFLGWQPNQGDGKADLPEKARLRITMQWREAHDPDYYVRADEEDYYRRPLANLRLQLLRQRDPEIKTLPADLFELAARTSGWPERLEHLPGSSTYEQVLEVPLEKAGRYAIQVEKQVNTQWIMAQDPVRKSPRFQLLEGLSPTGLRPLGTTTLPALEKKGDLRPRIFVEVIDETTRKQGRAVFVDYPTEFGVIGLPADARNVISVGAASLQNRPQPGSAYGSPMQMELARRPWLYAYYELDLEGGGALGTSIANAFAAGTAATYFSSGASRSQVLQWLRSQEGQALRMPAGKK